MSYLKEFIKRKIGDINRELYDIYEINRKARTAHFEANSAVKMALYHAEEMMKFKDENPELFTDCQAEFDAMVDDYEGHKYDHDIDPINELINWEVTPGKGSFIKNELYDILGKNQHRTFIILLREALKKADPVKAELL